jgi:hypothetical protein
MARAQPYQKLQGPSQRGVAAYQKGHPYAAGDSCQAPCYPPCHPPCQPEQPREAQPREAAPQAAAPGIAPGVFVAPPQSGVIEGPSRGFEFGNVSFTLPELTFGLPRLRWEGVKRLSRDTRMMTDRAAAPYVGNPYYAAAVAQGQMQRGAAPADQEEQREAEPRDAVPEEKPKAACESDLEWRIQCLEGQVQQQVQALQQCVEQLKALRSEGSAYQKSSHLVPPPDPPCRAAEAPSDLHFRSAQPLPSQAESEDGQKATRACYEVPLPTGPPTTLRRLPMIVE